ncbi:C25 family cysteine peptidase, partial [Methanocrinis sp.]|uniref:C25 family cysteine peptidase n=1 Tax=Methanocrinis sp. TaxID=3101522 RepID=UPI003D0E026F
MSFILFFSSAPAQGLGQGESVIRWQYRPEEPIIQVGFGGEILPMGAQNATKSIRIPGLENRIIPGEPVVPFRTARILIPFGEEIQDVKVLPGEKKNLGKILIEPGQDPLPISFSGNYTFTPLNETTYGSMEPYPKDVYSVVGLQEKQGYKILYINLYPIMYIPKTKDTYYFGTFDLEVKTAPAETLDRGLFRGSPDDGEHVKRMVDNPDEVSTYPKDIVPTGSSSLLEKDYDYVIITNSALKNAPGPYNFTALLDWKRSKGIDATIVTVEEIYAIYPGADEQEKIRGFIKDAYLNNGITYVLLGGDADNSRSGGDSWDRIIPARGLWAWDYETSPPKIPSDLYYACLDGNYDYNGNGIYGEPGDGPGGGEVDLMAEVYVGRAPVDSYAELSNFVRKTIAYESASSDPYLKEVLMVGEYLGFGGVSDWGGNSLDEIKDDSEASGYNTAGFPADYTKFSLYDRDREWDKSDLTEEIDGNVHAINHLGHANVGSAMKMKADDVGSLRNDRYFFGYSQGCYAGSFDNRDPDGIYLPDDSVLEHFVTEPHGAFSFVGNSRFGWGRRSTTDGPSQRYHRQFWDAVFGEGIEEIGRALQDAKEDNLGSIDGTSDGNVMRFCYYEINLLGDPETSFHKPFTASHDLAVVEMEIPSYTKPDRPVEARLIVKNKGLEDERNVTVQLLEGGVVRDSETISDLPSGGSVEASLSWSESVEGRYSLEAWVLRVEGEEFTEDNRQERSVEVFENRSLILLVDDDEDADYEIYYEQALAASGRGYVKADGPPSRSELSSFDCVIWLTGRDFTTTLTGEDQANLAAYLDAGGSLFLSGQDIGYNIQDTDFYRDYLQVEYVKD